MRGTPAARRPARSRSARDRRELPCAMELLVRERRTRPREAAAGGRCCSPRRIPQTPECQRTAIPSAIRACPSTWRAARRRRGTARPAAARGGAATPRAMRGIARCRRRAGRIPSPPFRSSGGMRGAVRSLPGLRDGHLQRSGAQHDRHVSAVRRGADRRRPLAVGRERVAGPDVRRRAAGARRRARRAAGRRRALSAPRSAPPGDQGRDAVEDPREAQDELVVHVVVLLEGLRARARRAARGSARRR